jgi:hypothetical protein
MTKKSLIVMQTPMEQLFDQEQSLKLQRVRDLGSADIKSLLRQGPLRFVVAAVGRPLQWIEEAKAFEYWKNRVINNLVEPKDGSVRFRLEDFPSEFAFAASEWKGAQYQVVLLEMHH